LGDGRIYRDLMRDPSVVMHEVSHAVIEQVTHLSTEGEGGSINEAFADYFAASITGNPRMGEVSFVDGPYRRNLENDAAWGSRNGGLYHDSLIVSGLLWELRRALGPEAALAFAVRVMGRLNADSDLADLKSQLSEAADELPEALRSRTHAALVSRGWR
jgi:Zn-dependent metalloprotease